MPRPATEAVPAGPDPRFPDFSQHERFTFPDPAQCPGDIIAAGGNLSPGMLLSAYRQGIFPWYNPEDPILWQSPDPRFIITPDTLHHSATMKKVLRRGDFEVRFDVDFPAVIRACSAARRPGQSGTWITGDMIGAYTELHRLGCVRTAESYDAGGLAGGCYGLLLGRVFFGESMFSRRSNASKAAFLSLAQRLFAGGVALIDCQVPSDHLRSLGGREISRKDFLRLIRILIP
ncbi:MAG: leucyl/phenylalanyl-tRNA--protein transferase [Spirochaetaceae bacterium]|jgi:leucyl/phenylalanyl-tRNA--protein transferase|nr:leucyl/phenylalanyl-tRNA--protein transferase [Spirochaetaceae bacterium]